VAAGGKRLAEPRHRIRWAGGLLIDPRHDMDHVHKLVTAAAPCSAGSTADPPESARTICRTAVSTENNRFDNSMQRMGKLDSWPNFALESFQA
jgi:hypothetical protein